MNIQANYNPHIVNKFHAEAVTASVNGHVSKSQINGLLTEIKNTDQKLTLNDCTKMRESVGALRGVLIEQNSKMQNKKAADLAKIDAHLREIISSQLETKSILKTNTSELNKNSVNPSQMKSDKKVVSFAE
ncbi:hypothetical protein ACLEUK_21565 [Pseudescherichia vulneris]